MNQNLTYKPTNEIQINCIFDRVASKMNLNLITSDTVHVYRHHYTPRKFKSGTWYTAVHFILHVYIKIEVYKSVKIHQINTITAYFWDSTVSCNIHANPRETKSGREGSGPPPKLFFQKDAKWCILLHFGYTICSVKSLNINVHVVWKNHERIVQWKFPVQIKRETITERA